MGVFSNVTIYVAGFLAGLALMWNLIGRLRRLIQENLECAAPVVPKQQIEFRTPGEKCLHVEGPLFTMAFARLSFALQDQATGQPIPLKRILFRSRASGFTKVQLLLYHCAINHAGSFDLAITGIQEGRDYSNCRILFTRPYRVKMVIFTVGLTLASLLTIASLVLGILAYTGQL